MDNIRSWVFRGRHLLIALEVVLAGGCVYAGWRVARGATPPAVTIHRRAPSASPPGTAGRFEAIDSAPGTTGSRPGEPPLIKPSRDLIERLNRSDQRLYQEEWQVLQVLMGGIRDYIEHRLLPSLFAHN